MSERFLDDLARTLATPMPRRRVLRLAGAALVAAAVPALRPRGALASKCGPDTLCSSLCQRGKPPGACGIERKNKCGQIGCSVAIPNGCLDETTKCCKGNDDAWICRKDERCEVTGGARCVPCASERMCGDACCRATQFCGSKNRSLCCDKGDDVCLVPNSPAGICCPRPTQCCFNSKQAACCQPNQKCRKGVCVCGDPAKFDCGDGECCKDKGSCCGKQCCDGGRECSKGKCCPKGQENCNGKCCDKTDCCEGMCCDGPNRICLAGKCCPLDRGVGSGKSARCCPPGTVASEDMSCCPKDDPQCCNGDLAPLCRKGAICVKGVCRKL